MKKTILAAGLALSALIAAPASAAVTFTFTPGPAYSPTAGFTVVDDFNSGVVGPGWGPTSNIVVQSGTNSSGAQPANSNPAGTDYLSVLAGGTATYTFAAPVSAFEFDWGSVDNYNTLVVYTNNSAYSYGGIFVPPATGNQTSGATNGVFQAWGTAGDQITGFKLASSQNSFEIDNLAVRAVPEPATWALMILGFGGIGALLRRRRDRGLLQLA